jgi:hypothetical protein
LTGGGEGGESRAPAERYAASVLSTTSNAPSS